MTEPSINWNELDFAGFADLARDDRLSKYEKIGFPNSYRQGHEPAVFADIRAKLSRLEARDLTVMDIGPGCSDLPQMLIDLCRQQGHTLHLVDSAEMLRQLPDGDDIVKHVGLFPKCKRELADLVGKVDVMLCYSVLHYVMIDANPFDFVDLAIELLAPGGEFLVGDIPNISKRRRFFSSEAGIKYHRAFTGTDTMPDVQFNHPVQRQIDDAVVLALVARARAAGADAYILPQPERLPMSNRREDLLIRRP